MKDREIMNTIPAVTDPISVAQRLVQLTRDSGESYVSKRKIMKLTFYCYAWFLVATENKKSLFEDKPQAWALGPVVPSAYYNWERIISVNNSDEINFHTNVDVDVLIRKVYSIYKELTPEAIVELTHTEVPWIYARKELPLGVKSFQDLSNDVIYDFYSVFLE